MSQEMSERHETRTARTGSDHSDPLTYRVSHRELLELLARHDPMGLIKIGLPDDEYSPEARAILPRLDEANSPADLRRIVHEEFVRMFSEELAGEESDYEKIAQEIWELQKSSVEDDGGRLGGKR